MMDQNRLVNRFLSYVKVESVSKNERNFGEYVLKELKESGCTVQVDPEEGKPYGSNYGNIMARLPGTIESKPILFSCHLDTVYPGQNICPQIRDGVIYSDGTTILGADDKAGIAALLEALQVLQENHIPHGDIEMVFSFMEERGMLGAKCLQTDWFRSKEAFILDDGTIGRIVVQGPAQDKMEVTIIGKPSHAGVAPEQGISSIQAAAQAISRMKLLRIDDETTANIGSILSEGETNIVPVKTVIKAESRSLNNQKLDQQTDHMADCFIAAAKEIGAQADIQRNRLYSAFCIQPDAPIVQAAQRACSKINLPCELVRTGGGSDANIFNAHGITSIALGIGMQQPHTLEEHIKADDLVTTCKLILALIDDYAGQRQLRSLM